MNKMGMRAAGFGLVMALAAGQAMAADAESCKKVRLSDVGWTDIQVTTATTAAVLEALGYEPEITQLTVPVTFAALKDKDMDVFLGNWMPSQTEAIKPYADEGAFDVVGQNLEGAGFGLVVPDYVQAEGVNDIKDLGKFKDKFNAKIYGIEAGAAGNKNIQNLIDDPKNGLEGFELVESSEAGMLTEAEQTMKAKDWVVFLGWTPHPVMGGMKIKYLGGMEASGFGEAKVFTNTRKGYAAECPNVGAFIKNVKFTLPMENVMMDAVIKGGNPGDVAKDWLKANPDAVTPWLAGVTTFDGGDAVAAVKAALAN
ncbi:choline ABC transporter substrate-binding protein [Mesorhizobium sp. BE184]|uniref:choline ABC transporter substrate-binding protein n=1 Tax=Mesorhizobium sp. BE184 TaxID=2817714 RepID=UPI002864097F|nr:choline ABC transporter substrate-binding protein [Mesorhizobium sp. BE184]MDR7033595.1 glycine betaine/proline transport system substrate-binding protein [Mesorhizobium sp. BE184]